MLANIEMYWTKYLLSERREPAIIRWLTSCAPRWCGRLSVLGPEDKLIPLDLGHSRWLSEAAELSMTDYGRELSVHKQRFRSGPRLPESSFEMHGANRQVVAVIGTDLLGVWRRLDGNTFINNYISLQILTSRVEGRSWADWAYDCFTSGCCSTCPEYAYAEVHDEYEALNMDRSHGVEAIGRDFAKYLPGIYWLNYFGPHLTRVMNRDRLLSAPAIKVEPLGEGVLLVQRERPEDWDRPEVMERRKAIRKHIGAGYFFDRQDTVTPPAGLGFESHA
jgi:hypothetical protein